MNSKYLLVVLTTVAIAAPSGLHGQEQALSGDAEAPLPTASRWRGAVYRMAAVLLFLLSGPFAITGAFAQCAGNVSTPQWASDCAARAIPQDRVATLDISHIYTLAELVDIAESNNPITRIYWERAKQMAGELGIAKSAYFPLLVGVAGFGDSRSIEPFPKPLAPDGYVMVKAPVVQPEITLQYLLFDFGKREAAVDAARAQKLVSGANFIQANQEVAFRVSSAYYKLQTAEEHLQAAQDTLTTAQTTQAAAEAQMNNGRATLPDVLQARAETSQAVYDLASAEGDEKVARVALTEVIGVEPSPEIKIASQKGADLPQSLSVPIDALIDLAIADRQDLKVQAEQIREAKDAIRAAKADYRPKIVVSAAAADTSTWPSANFGTFGTASRPTWSATLGVQWTIFDGGARKNELAIAESKRREAQNGLRATHDEAVREVWTSYLAFRTALEKEQAALAVLDSASESYSASLDAYKYGVRNLVDVVTAENRLAQARLANVSARSQLLLEAVNLDFVTGNLLRNQPLTNQLPKQNGPKP
jgi:TolC family type I secretion outer membrane protein